MGLHVDLGFVVAVTKMNNNLIDVVSIEEVNVTSVVTVGSAVRASIAPTLSTLAVDRLRR